MDKQKKLQALAETRDPSLRMSRLLTERTMGDAIMKMDLVKGEKGDKGDSGKDGINGSQGSKGIDGEKGDKGDKGDKGISGRDGKNGKDGKNGIDGLPGKDADHDTVTNNVINTLKTKKIQDIANLDDLVAFLKRGGFRGGGGSSVAGVTSFNTRTGAVTLTSSDVTTALGYTPQGQLTLTTSGISGAATLVGNILNIPRYAGNVTSVFGRTGAITAQSGDYDTSLVTENTNLYFTNARAIASTLTGYASGAGTISASDSILSAIQKLNGNQVAGQYWQRNSGVLSPATITDKIAIGATTANSNLDIVATIPEKRLVTSSDSLFARWNRTTSSDLLTGYNNVIQSGGVGMALSYNGSNQYYTANDTGLSIGTSLLMSFSIWVKYTPGSNNTPYFSYGVGGTSISWNGNPTFGNIQAVIGGTSRGSANTSVNFADNQWHNIIVSINGLAMIVYLDGTSYNVTLSSYPAVVLGGATGIDNRTNGIGNIMTMGSQDQLLVYNRIISTTSGAGGTNEVAAIYNSGGGTTTPPTSGLIRNFSMEEGTGSIMHDTNPTGTQYDATLFNSPAWVAGIVPIASSATETPYYTVQDGVINSERGISTWGDFVGRTVLQGKWFQLFQANTYPLVSNNSGQFLFNPSRSTAGVPTIASTIDISGNVTIGAGYVGVNAAPTNGLLVQGNTGIGTTTVSAKLHLLSTTEQLRSAYDTSNYVSFTTSSIGSLTIAPTGTNPNITLTPSGTGKVILSTLTTNGLVTTSGGTGTLSVTVPGTNVLTFLGTPSSANLAAAITDETGSGSLVFATSPTLVTPALGTPTALVGTNITGTGTGFTSGSTNAIQSATTTVNVSSSTAPTSGQVLTATSGTAATWQTLTVPGVPTVVAFSDLTAQTAANASVATYTAPAADGTYEVSGYLTVTSVTLDVITFNIAWTDENSTSQSMVVWNNKAQGSASTISNSSFSPIPIRVKSGTAITVSTALTTSTGSIAYDVGATIIKLR